MPEKKNLSIFRLILFGILFLLILTGLSTLSDPVKWYDDNRVQDRNARITEIMKQEPDTIDVFNMGDSLSLASLSPMEMWRQNGYTSFNIGADGIRMPEIYYSVVEASEEQKIRYLLFETLPLFRYEKNQDRQMLLSQPLYHRFAFLKYHNVWKTLAEGRGIKTYYKGYLVNREVQPYTGDPDYLDQELKGVKTDIPRFNRIWFERIKKYCDDRGITIIFYSAPSPKNYNRKRLDSVADLAGEMGIEYFELNGRADEIGIDWNTDSNDQGDHMNLDGVKKMTAFFGDYFAGQGDLTDHRPDPAFSSWNEELTAYDQLVDEMEGMSFFLLQEQIKKERREEKEKNKQE